MSGLVAVGVQAMNRHMTTLAGLARSGHPNGELYLTTLAGLVRSGGGVPISELTGSDATASLDSDSQSGEPPNAGHPNLPAKLTDLLGADSSKPSAENQAGVEQKDLAGWADQGGGSLPFGAKPVTPPDQGA